MCIAILKKYFCACLSQASSVCLILRVLGCCCVWNSEVLQLVPLKNISDCKNESLIVLFCFVTVLHIFTATCRKNIFRLYTFLGNKCLNWLCLNKGQCLCNLVPIIWCLKVSFEINSIVWIRDKTVNIQKERKKAPIPWLD